MRCRPEVTALQRHTPPHSVSLQSPLYCSPLLRLVSVVNVVATTVSAATTAAGMRAGAAGALVCSYRSGRSELRASRLSAVVMPKPYRPIRHLRRLLLPRLPNQPRLRRQHHALRIQQLSLRRRPHPALHAHRRQLRHPRTHALPHGTVHGRRMVGGERYGDLVVGGADG